MKLLLRSALVSGILIAGLLPAFAGGGSFSGSGQWIVSPPSAATFSSVATSGSGGQVSIVVVDLTHSGTLVYQVYTVNGSPATITGGATVGAGSYHIVHVIYSTPGTADTTVNW